MAMTLARKQGWVRVRGSGTAHPPSFAATRRSWNAMAWEGGAPAMVWGGRPRADSKAAMVAERRRAAAVAEMEGGRGGGDDCVGGRGLGSG